MNSINDMGTLSVLEGVLGNKPVIVVTGLKGMNLVLVDRLENELELVRTEMARTGVKVISLVADIGTYEGCTEVLEKSEKKLGEIDVLVSNAGLEVMSAYEASPLQKEYP